MRWATSQNCWPHDCGGNTDRIPPQPIALNGPCRGEHTGLPESLRLSGLEHHVVEMDRALSMRGGIQLACLGQR